MGLFLIDRLDELESGMRSNNSSLIMDLGIGSVNKEMTELSLVINWLMFDQIWFEVIDFLIDLVNHSFQF